MHNSFPLGYPVGNAQFTIKDEIAKLFLKNIFKRNAVHFLLKLYIVNWRIWCNNFVIDNHLVYCL